jgi:hypothetical protein
MRERVSDFEYTQNLTKEERIENRNDTHKEEPSFFDSSLRGQNLSFARNTKKWKEIYKWKIFVYTQSLAAENTNLLSFFFPIYK